MTAEGATGTESSQGLGPNWKPISAPTAFGQPKTKRVGGTYQLRLKLQHDRAASQLDRIRRPKEDRRASQDGAGGPLCQWVTCFGWMAASPWSRARRAR